MGQVVLEFPKQGWVNWEIKGNGKKDILKTLKDFEMLLFGQESLTRQSQRYLKRLLEKEKVKIKLKQQASSPAQ